MANQDIFGLEKKKKKNSGDVPEMKPIKFRVDPFHIMPGDIERVNNQWNAERHPLDISEEMPNNRVEAPKEEIKKKEEE